VRELRRAADLTQEQLAARAKLDGKHVQAIEAGEGNPTLATLLALARGLGCKAADLL
jgi:transcriptional regulator with XRE-family HTH domain